jgi:hypothetical protein
MIHHLSIAARDPQHVAEVLAEFMGGAATRFTPAYCKRFTSLNLTQEQAGELFGASARTGQRRGAARLRRARSSFARSLPKGGPSAAHRRRLPCDGSLDREYRDDRAATAGFCRRISDANPPARGARRLTSRAVA